MKKNIKLSDLKVQSFVTSLEKGEKQTVKGGVKTKQCLESMFCNDISQGARVCSQDSC